MKKGIVVLVVLLLAVCSTQVQAGEMDILVDMLVEKGVLNEKEAQQIEKVVRQKAQEEREQIVKETTEQLKEERLLLADAIPEWFRNTKLKGDLRLRYEMRSRDVGSDRYRARYRLRLGFVTKVNEKVDVGWALDSGGSDPRSTNQSMGNSFESPDIRLDMAYATYRPTSWLTLTGGKFKNPLWTPSDLLWDGDIRPEGASAVMQGSPTAGLDLFMNANYWILDEYKSSSQDPAMIVLQPGYKVALGKSMYLKQSFNYYNFINEQGTTFDYSSETNSLDADGNLLYEYDSIGTSAELGIKNPFDGVQLLALFGEYMENLDPSDDNQGWLVGAKIGHKKVKKLHDWQFKVTWRELERDAWLDIFPNSDAYGGKTDVEGLQTGFKYGLMKNVYAAVSYYKMARITGESNDEDLFQVDLNFKF